eukprot:SAG31_NODE_3773_length_3894_cov_3.633922_2_plen_123_part_00
MNVAAGVASLACAVWVVVVPDDVAAVVQRSFDRLGLSGANVARGSGNFEKVAAKVVAMQIAAGKTDECVAFRQTGNCDPHGPREASLDKSCQTIVQNGVRSTVAPASAAGSVSKHHSFHAQQ